MSQQPIFVFGSNLAGIHGAGAARYAFIHKGAVWGEGVGLHGSSYALPTKDRHILTLPRFVVEDQVALFIDTARKHPELAFQVTRVGCGLAGFNDKDIAPMFKGAPTNCQFDSEWKKYLGDGYIYWGTF